MRCRLLLSPAQELPLTANEGSLYVLKLATPRPYEEQEIRRLSPALHAPGSLLAVYDHPDAGLLLWGVLRSRQPPPAGEGPVARRGYPRAARAAAGCARPRPPGFLLRQPAITNLAARARGRPRLRRTTPWRGRGAASPKTWTPCANSSGRGPERCCLPSRPWPASWPTTSPGGS